MQIKQLFIYNKKWLMFGSMTSEKPCLSITDEHGIKEKHSCIEKYNMMYC